MKRSARGIMVVAWLALPACGGASGTATDAGAHGGAGHDGGAPTGAITWLDDGTPRALATAEAVRRTDTKSDTLEIVGIDPAGMYNLSIAVAGPMALAGPYTCSTANGNADLAEITYTQKVLIPSTCTVTVMTPTPADGGAPHVTGTFSFDLAKEAGTESITDGRFDLAVTTESP